MQTRNKEINGSFCTCTLAEIRRRVVLISRAPFIYFVARAAVEKWQMKLEIGRIQRKEEICQLGTLLPLMIWCAAR